MVKMTWEGGGEGELIRIMLMIIWYDINITSYMYSHTLTCVDTLLCGQQSRWESLADKTYQGKIEDKKGSQKLNLHKQITLSLTHTHTTINIFSRTTIGKQKIHNLLLHRWENFVVT